MLDDVHSQTNPEIEEIGDHLLWHLQKRNIPKRMEQRCEQNTFGNIVHQCKSHFLLRPSHDVFDLHGKSLKSYLDLINQSRSCDIKEPAEFNKDGRSFVRANHEQAHTEIQFCESRKLIRTVTIP